MGSEVRTAARERLRRRELASDRRAARFGRAKAWRLQWSFVRRHWAALAGLVALVPLSALPLVLRYHGTARGVVIGAAIATGVWLALVAVIVLSGCASALAGVVAEGWTVDEVRPLLRRGWRLVIGLKIRGDLDIDHVLVGPPGAVVLETKWSAEPWRLGRDARPFMARRLADAVEQARRNTADVRTQFRRALRGVPVYPVVVLWPLQAAGDSDILLGAVTVVGGGSLRRLVDKLPAGELDREHIERLWASLNEHARRRDTGDVQRGLIRPTVGELLRRWVGEPALGFIVAVYAIAAVASVRDSRLETLGLLAVGFSCLAVLRTSSLHRAAWGAAAAFLVTVGAAVVTLVIR